MKDKIKELIIKYEKEILQKDIDYIMSGKEEGKGKEYNSKHIFFLKGTQDALRLAVIDFRMLIDD
jgi:hypothetical protein